MTDFDDIRPYNNDELPAALQRIAQWQHFPQALRFIYANADIEAIKSKLLAVKTIHDFQATLMNDAILRIIRSTTSGFTHSGLNHLRRGEAYLFISNHRDITLDAFLLQHILLEHRGDTSHIVFGQNLLSEPVIEDLFRSNKLIRMERGGTPRTFYNSLLHLSQYLDHLLLDERQSVWIAQKNGRAKDGIDSTAPAMLKMLCLGHKGDPLQALCDMHLVPVSVSYEWDPCDAMKANELYQSASGKYLKAKDEDMKSVVTGIIGDKGKVHLAIGTPLTRRELEPPAGADLYEHAAAALDHHIQSNYHLMPTNYVAYSLLTGRDQRGRFSEATRTKFLQRLDALPNADLRQLMVEAYANPVIASRRQPRNGCRN